MALKLAEGVVDEVKAYLTTNIAAKLTALNTEYGDGITLAVPAVIYVGEMSLEAVSAWPVFYVLVDRTEVDVWKQTSVAAKHELTVGAVVIDQLGDTEGLRRRLYRYMRAIWELLIEAHFGAGVTFHVAEGTIPTMDFSPTLTRGDQMVAAAEITLGTWLQETKT